MIDERVEYWRKLAYSNIFDRKTKFSTGKLSAPTFSDRYFELMGFINQLQSALNDACDVIEKKGNR